MDTNRAITDQQRSDIEAFAALPDNIRQQLLAYAQGLLANPGAKAG